MVTNEVNCLAQWKKQHNKTAKNNASHKQGYKYMGGYRPKEACFVCLEYSQKKTQKKKFVGLNAAAVGNKLQKKIEHRREFN